VALNTIKQTKTYKHIVESGVKRHQTNKNIQT
jgi:hypothetical protein